MNFNRIQTIVDKEWAEVFKNRIVLFTIAFLPILFALLPLGMLYGTRHMGDEVNDLPAQFLEACGDLGPMECLQVFLLNQFLVLFMVMPLIIPIAIAAYSIVGEKTTRSLEPLLATPITTEELLAGKSLAAAIPAILATWGAFAIFSAAAPFVASPRVAASLGGPVWSFTVFVIGPLIAILAVNFAVVVSSRVNDPRVAEQISAVIVVPLLGLIFGQLAGVIILNLTLMLVAAAVLLALDVGMIYLGARLFQRETILTKWK